VPDEPISVPDGPVGAEVKWIANYDDKFKGPIPAREALAESRNAVAVWIAETIGMYFFNEAEEQNTAVGHG